MEDVGILPIWPFGLFYGYFVYFVAIWYILWLFDMFFPVLVCCTKKNLATLAQGTAATGAEGRFSKEARCQLCA
jgi:hypothetical protein